ncbi:MAG: hypothetical protein HGB11_09455, partial [Chlorobiales bacterium]|nr:hypothetical protein [Chlorobiales bacterium]
MMRPKHRPALFRQIVSTIFIGLLFCTASCGNQNKQASIGNGSGSGTSENASTENAAPTGIAFERRSEPKEQAFSILVPKGWKTEGGIFRVNALTAGGPLNAIEAKCDLSVMSDQTGTVMFRIFPDITYALVGIGGGFFPVGSNYQGAEVHPYENAQQHLKTLFRKTHPSASSVKFLAIKQLPGEIEVLEKANAYTNSVLAQLGGSGMMFRHDAAGAIIEYTEAGTRYREALLTGIVNMQAAFTWKNTRTLLFRAPVNEFDKWRAAMDIIRFSVRFNPEWVLKEA